jgi:hypothetical protein
MRQMCTWERFCAFAREPERRLVGGDARLTVEGVIYEVAAELAGETVILWWGLFDQDLYVEHGDRRFGPYTPSGGPIPLYRYRKYQKSKIEERADRVAELAVRLGLPRATLDGTVPSARSIRAELGRRPFSDPDPFQQLAFPSPLAAKHAIADELGMPLARLSVEDRAFIDALLRDTLEKPAVLTRVREHFKAAVAGVASC